MPSCWNSGFWSFGSPTRKGKAPWTSGSRCSGFDRLPMATEVTSLPWLLVAKTIQSGCDEQFEFSRMLSSFGNLLPDNHDPVGLRCKSNYSSGKTGSGQIDDLYIGWFVGFLEKKITYTFWRQYSGRKLRG